MARHWYPWYPGDYARDTMHLAFVEDAAYRRMLDHYFSFGCLPANAEILLRVCRAFAEDEKAAVLKVAKEFFTEVDGFLVQDRVAKEIAKSLYLSGIRSDAGKSGASKTNGKRSAKDAASESANIPAIADTTHNSQLIGSKPSCAIPSHGKESKADPEGFAEVWEAYPKRAGGNSRTEAVAAYRARIKSGVLPADMLAGVQRYAAFIRSTGKEGSVFVKQGATFFGPAEHWAEPWEVPAENPQVSPAVATDWRQDPQFRGCL